MDNGVGPEESGQRRPRDGGAVRTPMAGEAPEAGVVERLRLTVRPGGIPQPRSSDPVADTDAAGLRTFNIGLVPASVTPPRTWKRAAWFAVLSSAGVLVGLAIAAAKLVGTSGPVERIGLPGYPSDVPMLSGLATNDPRRSSQAAEPHAAVGAGLRAPAPVRQTGTAQTGTAQATDTSPGRTSGGPGSAGPVTPPPQVTTVTNTTQPPVVDGRRIVERTEKFYEEVATNSNTALSMATEYFQQNTKAVLEQHYSDVSQIEVKEITVDPSKGVTVSLLQITRKDGSMTTEKRELTFTTGDEPLINDERQAAVGQR
jgi:hypothetical protein